MGLLDDAIREHLELKRQHGADPDEVAHEERTVLAPLRESRDPESEESPSAADELEPSGQGPRTEANEPRKLDPSHAIQETVEIDMRTVLEGMDSEEGSSWFEADDEPDSESAAPAVVAGDRRSGSELDSEEDPLELEAPDAPAKRVGRFGRLMGRGRGIDRESPDEGSLL
jgi:hypothetical protein